MPSRSQMASWVRLLLLWVWGHVPARPVPSSWRLSTSPPRGPSNPSLVADAALRPAAHLPGLLLGLQPEKSTQSTRSPRSGQAHWGCFPFAPTRSIVTGMVSAYRHRLSQDSRSGAHTELGSPRILLLQLLLRTDYRSIPGGPVVKNLPAKADVGSIPGKIPHMEKQLSLCPTASKPMFCSLRPRLLRPLKLKARPLRPQPQPLRPRPLGATNVEATTTDAEATKAEGMTTRATKAEATTAEATDAGGHQS